MSLRSTKQMIERELRSAENMAAFVLARRRRTELGGYRNVRSLLAVLCSESPHRIAERELLVRVALAEHQHKPHSLWAGTLLLACYPILCRLRGRVRGDALQADDIDQLVVSTFLDVIVAFPLDRKHNRTFMHLRQMTQRRVFQQLRREQREQDRVRVADLRMLGWYEQLCSYEHRSCTWPETRPEKHSHSTDESRAQIAFLQKHASGQLNADKLDPVIATTVHGERLRSYVQRLYPDVTPAEHRRLYQRIKRRHSRGMAKLRQLLAAVREEANQTTP